MGVRHVALVTDELFPFTRGGIGRLLHNLVVDSLLRSPDVEFHLLLCGPAFTGRADAIRQRFGPRVRVHTVELSSATARHEGGRLYPPTSAFTDTRWHAESLEIMLALRRLAAGVDLDWIEFPDYRGWAMCTTQEKLLGRAFARTGIAVRLHSTDGLLQHFEPRRVLPEQAGRFEIERKALRDADLIVGHIGAVAAFNARYYGFDDRWRERVRIEFPPVHDAAPPATRAERPGDAQPDLLFATKIQPFKRPDLFVKGAALFMSDSSDYRGRAILACHAEDEALLARTLAMIPPELEARFEVVRGSGDRDALLGRCVVVIPSDFESLNLTAYEASMAGGRLVLNGTCPAFGDDSPFVSGKNCWKFDGSVEGLAAALRDAVNAPAPAVVDAPCDTPYWMRPSAATALPAAAEVDASATPPHLSVVVSVGADVGSLAGALAAYSDSGDPELELVVVGGPETPAAQLSHAVASWSGRGQLRVVRSPVSRGDAGYRNLGLAAASGTYVVSVDAADRFAPEFLSSAVAALDRHPEFDVVAPTCASCADDEELARAGWSHFSTFLGDAPTIGLTANLLGPSLAVIRRSALEGVEYDERLAEGSEWKLLLDLALSNRRFLVTNDVQAFRRGHPTSRDAAPTAEHVALQHRVLETVAHPLPPSARLGALVTEAGGLVERADRLQREQRWTKSLLDAARADAHRARRDVEASREEAQLAGTEADAARHESARARAELAIAAAAREAAEAELRRLQEDKPVRYSMVDFANERLKVMPLVHPALKSLAKALREGVRFQRHRASGRRRRG